MRYGRRLSVLLLATAAGFAVVWIRAFQLEVAQHARWAEKAESSRRPRSRVEAPRGRILDATGAPLAEDRTVVQLAFVGAEWETRARWRCSECGRVHFRRDPAAPRPRGVRASEAVAPTRCSCGAKAPQFERMPDADLSPLERALSLPPGTLAALATLRVADLERAVAERVHRLAPDAEGAERDLATLLRQDFFARPRPVTRLPFSGPEPVALRELPVEAVRLLELDSTGRYRGFRAQSAVVRRYPERSLLAQVVGFATAVQSEEKETLGDDATFSTRIGRTGLERFYDAALRGTPGVLRWVRDDDGDLVPRAETPPVAGHDVRLAFTIDACREAQKDLEGVATAAGYGAKAGPPSGGFVAIDAETGEVLAWAETPVFDLDGDREEAVRWTDEVENRGTPDEDPWFVTGSVPNATLSRVAQVAVEPGSSVKPLVAITLLAIDAPLPDGFVCAGPSRGPNDKPGCHDHGARVHLSLEDALCVSCNRWFAYAVSRAEVAALVRERLPDGLRALGIGRAPAVDLWRPARGLFRPEDVPSLRNVAIGQGPILATPLQMARVMALFADGRRMPVPRLASAVGDSPRPAEAEEIALPEAALARVKAGMLAVVADRSGGTAARAFAASPLPAGARAWGKTGTAQVSKGGDFDAGATGRPCHHWFVGFARGEGPGRTIAFACVLHARTEGGAGETAARVVARFLRWWFERERP